MEHSEGPVFTVVIKGKPEGPFSIEELQGMDIRPETFVKHSGMQDYKEAHEVPDLRALFGFSYQQTAPQYFASFDQRLLACVIDYFILLLIYIAVLTLSFTFMEEQNEKIMLALMFLPAVPVMKIIYGIFADASARQGTIGKQLLNVKVTDLVGQRIGLGRALIRNVAKVLSVLPLLFGYLYSFLNKKQQCWHDIAAKTLVIKDRLI